jgi:hypothetical protein
MLPEDGPEMAQENQEEDLDKILEEFRIALIKTWGPIGQYVHSRFEKDIGIESCKTRLDIEVGMGRIHAPILEKLNSFMENFDRCIEEGLSLHNALEKVKEDIVSQEDKEIFEIFQRLKTVEIGLKRQGFIQKGNFTPANGAIDPGGALSQFETLYDIFTGSKAKTFDQWSRRMKIGGKTWFPNQ